MAREPLEAYLRTGETPPEGTHLLLRGSPLTAAKFADHAARTARAYTFRGAAEGIGPHYAEPSAHSTRSRFERGALGVGRRGEFSIALQLQFPGARCRRFGSAAHFRRLRSLGRDFLRQARFFGRRAFRA